MCFYMDISVRVPIYMYVSLSVQHVSVRVCGHDSVYVCVTVSVGMYT